MTIGTTRRADQDLIDIYMAGAAAFGREQAERYFTGLKTLFGLLAENPLRARLRTESVRPARLYPYRAHVVAYVEQEKGFLIVRVLHGCHDWARHLT